MPEQRPSTQQEVESTAQTTEQEEAERIAPPRAPRPDEAQAGEADDTPPERSAPPGR